jgi:LuxR family maltose regulon positive regulatory protein
VRHSALQGHAIWLTSSHQARLWLKIGDRPAAAAWARAYEGGELALIGGPPQEIHQYTCDIALARIRIAQGQLEAAGELLDRIRQLAEQNARLQLLVEAMIVRAELWQARGNSYQAQQSLTHALALAEAEGYVQLFARASAPIRSLLAQLYETMRSQPAQVPGQPSFGYIARLRSRLGPGAPALASILGAQIVPAPPAERAEAQPEQLSQREREVLRKLAEGRSNQQIARELFISIATVKTHLIHIYRKLGARTRTEALAQARAQHLL